MSRRPELPVQVMNLGKNKGFLPPELTQRRLTFSGEYWQVDFTPMPPLQGSCHFLVFIDTFSEQVETFSTPTEKAGEVTKALLKLSFRGLHCLEPPQGQWPLPHGQTYPTSSPSPRHHHLHS